MISPCKDCTERTVRCWNKARREKMKNPTLEYEIERNNKIKRRRKR